MNTKVCTKCKREKLVDKFYKDKKRKDGLRGWCKECFMEVDALWRLKNKEKTKRIRKRYNKKNKTIKLMRDKKWRESNSKKVTEYRKEWQGNHKEYFREKSRNKNIQARITNRLQTRIWSALKKAEKSKRTVELLGCSIKAFMIYIEIQFTKGMSWVNYGKWHIDHMVPCSYFNLTDSKEQSVCFHYTNLQPLWAIDNLRKGNRI